ncbi:hypothetical protein B296_00043634 [Ensete ventricosum]|uniref:Uncharacterized protein n=1 Tax=Ensete ventricosum TaxID=4639 RepID=A0A426XHX3_ENSVE|nr:hypothetical protein B296_00043634 [Ensete ventricosum]
MTWVRVCSRRRQCKRVRPHGGVKATTRGRYRHRNRGYMHDLTPSDSLLGGNKRTRCTRLESGPHSIIACCHSARVLDALRPNQPSWPLPVYSTLFVPTNLLLSLHLKKAVVLFNLISAIYSQQLLAIALPTAHLSSSKCCLRTALCIERPFPPLFSRSLCRSAIGELLTAPTPILIANSSSRL